MGEGKQWRCAAGRRPRSDGLCPSRWRPRRPGPRGEGGRSDTTAGRAVDRGRAGDGRVGPRPRPFERCTHVDARRARRARGRGRRAVTPVLRSLRAGRLSARTDRARLRGLFGATLDVNRSVGIDETRTTVLASAETLLRAPEVTLTDERPDGPALAEPMQVADRTLWLGAAGRSGTEPFDEADRALLAALASVAGVALANAELYAEVRQQREHLSVITRSLGEGVCAVSEDGRITFMNQAGAAMLGWYGPGTDDDGPGADGGAGLSARARPAGHGAGAQRLELRHPLPAPRRITLPRHHDRLTGGGGPGLGGGRHRVPRHLRAQGLRGAAGSSCLPGRADRVGQPPPPARPPRPRAVAGEPDRQHGGGAVL